jgi:hypothetical protein
MQDKSAKAYAQLMLQKKHSKNHSGCLSTKAFKLTSALLTLSAVAICYRKEVIDVGSAGFATLTGFCLILFFNKLSSSVAAQSPG